MEYRQLTLLCYFQMTAKACSHVYTCYPFSLQLPSHPGCHITLSRVQHWYSFFITWESWSLENLLVVQWPLKNHLRSDSEKETLMIGPHVRSTESEFLWMGSKHLYFVVKAPDSDSNVLTGLRTNDWHWFSVWGHIACNWKSKGSDSLTLHMQEMIEIKRWQRCRQRYTYWIFFSAIEKEHLKHKTVHALIPLLPSPEPILWICLLQWSLKLLWDDVSNS